MGLALISIKNQTPMPSTPEIKTIRPITFLFHRTETTLADLINHVPVGQQLF